MGVDLITCGNGVWRFVQSLCIACFQVSLDGRLYSVLLEKLLSIKRSITKDTYLEYNAMNFLCCQKGSHILLGHIPFLKRKGNQAEMKYTFYRRALFWKRY